MPARRPAGGWQRPLPRRSCLALLAMAGCGRVERPALGTGPGGGADGGAEIMVVRRRWHTDVAFTAEGLPAPLDAAAALLPGAAWLSVGFGDRAWFAEGAVGPLAALGALFGGAAALLITGLPRAPEWAFGAEEVVRLRVSPAGRAAMLGFIAAQLESAQPMARGPYPGGLFFGTGLRYAASYTCNTWTVDAMRAAGLPVSADGVLFASQVMALARGA